MRLQPGKSIPDIWGTFPTWSYLISRRHPVKIFPARLFIVITDPYRQVNCTGTTRQKCVFHCLCVLTWNLILRATLVGLYVKGDLWAEIHNHLHIVNIMFNQGDVRISTMTPDGNPYIADVVCNLASPYLLFVEHRFRVCLQAAGDIWYFPAGPWPMSYHLFL